MTPPAEPPPPAARFSDAERRLLLAQPRIGPGVVARLEALGIGSLDALQRHGIDLVVQAVCAHQGHISWANRRRPLAQALQQASRAQDATAAQARPAAVPAPRAAIAPGVTVLPGPGVAVARAQHAAAKLR